MNNLQVPVQRNRRLRDGETATYSFIVGKIKKPVTINKIGKRLWLKFGYSPGLIKEVKTSFPAPKWHGFETPPLKQWSVADSERAWFLIDYLCGYNPYAPYDAPLQVVEFPERVTSDGQVLKPRLHQNEMASHILQRHCCIIAGEMGTGKTLSAMLAMEASGKHRWFWVAPKSALTSVKLEFQKWRSPIIPEFVTYSSLNKLLESWVPGMPAPDGVIFDESSRVKTPTAKRSQAAAYLAEKIREEHGDAGYVVAMSGTPAPKSPLDWWFQCEIARPGFLREGGYHVFKSGMALIKEAQNEITGGVFPSLVTWMDDENKCSVCGKFENDFMHEFANFAEADNDPSSAFHVFQKSVNEVSRLYDRMGGLVLVKMKKDCLDLPEKQYKIIQCKLSESMKRAAKLITAKAKSSIEALTFLRELSDGFQYQETEVGKEQCPNCTGRGLHMQKTYVGPEKTWDFLQSINYNIPVEDPDDAIIDPYLFPQYYEMRDGPCGNCAATGQIISYNRTVAHTKSPKEEVLNDIIDEHEDVGRLVVYAGFTGSVDKVVEVFKNLQWDYIRVDGRGWASSLEGSPEELLLLFQGKCDKKIGFIGQPGAAGMGLTLTASPTVVYYSNDFNAESRIQSEDRIHRMGMDTNRGATIIDIINLPSDQLVLDNLKKKRKLQALSLGQVADLLS